MALNLDMFKKRPLLWGGVAIVVFVLFYMLFSRGGQSAETSGGNLISTGPSEAQLAYASQMGMAQIQANAVQQQYAAEVAMKNAEISGDVKLGELAYQAGLAQINAEKEMYETQSEYSLQTARVAAETNLAMAQMDKDVLTTQLNTQASMFNQQLIANNQMLLIGQISTAKKKDRDQLIAALGGVNYRGQPAGNSPLYLPAPSNNNMLPGKPVAGNIA